jgi:hypothetical protein
MRIPLLGYIRDLALGKMQFGVRRSSGWHKVREEHLREHPKCECCGGVEQIEVHHKKPVSLFPELELEKENLMTLCEKRSCHLAIGHLYSYRSYNKDIETDVKMWREKVNNRP